MSAPISRDLFLTGLLLGAGCVPQAQYDETLHELGQARKHMTDSEGELAQCRDELARLEQSSQADLDTTRKDLEAELERLRAASERRLAAFRELQTKFKSMIDAGNLEVYIRRGRMIVGLPSKVLFPSGKAELSKSGQTTLRKVSKVFKELPERRIEVAGHTDNKRVGEKLDFEDNWELSTARALTVTRFMIEGGVKAENLAAAGYGEFDPVGGNESSGGRRRNRRIELILVPDLSELPDLAKEIKADEGA